MNNCIVTYLSYANPALCKLPGVLDFGMDIYFVYFCGSKGSLLTLLMRTMVREPRGGERQTLSRASPMDVVERGSLKFNFKPRILSLTARASLLYILVAFLGCYLTRKSRLNDNGSVVETDTIRAAIG
jgi:hypothetical protein